MVCGLGQGRRTPDETTRTSFLSRTFSVPSLHLLPDAVAALKPHLASIDQLSAVVAQLESAATVLDQQTKQLEAALAEVLS